MKQNEKSDFKTEIKHFTILGRVEYEFVLLLEQKFSKYFNDMDYIEALVKQKMKASKYSNVFWFVSIFVAFLMLFQHSSLELSLKLPVGNLEGFALSNIFLLFVLSVTTAGFVGNFVNILIIQRQLRALFENLGFNYSDAMSAAGFVASKWSTQDLCMEVFNIKYLGLKSGVGHVLFVSIVLLFLSCIFLMNLALLFTAAFVGVLEAQMIGGLSLYLVALPAAFSIFVLVLGTIFALSIPLKFTVDVPIEESEDKENADCSFKETQENYCKNGYNFLVNSDFPPHLDPIDIKD